MSEHTARAYSGDVRQFWQWLSDRGLTVDDVSPGVVTLWLADLAESGRSPSTCRRKLAAVNSFFRFARAEGATTVDPAPFQAPKVHRDDANVGSISAKDAHVLWDATEGRLRLRALVAVMLFCGLRVSEACGLDMDDMQEQQGSRVLRVMGKGSKPRTAVLPAPAVLALTEWLDRRGTDPGPVLRTSAGTALSVRQAHREISRLGRDCGMTIHPHTLRHTFATAAVDSGADVLKVTTALGHASPTTTMRYVRGRDAVRYSPVHRVADTILEA
jgi:site-specific recombinase XerD